MQLLKRSVVYRMGEHKGMGHGQRTDYQETDYTHSNPVRTLANFLTKHRQTTTILEILTLRVVL